MNRINKTRVAINIALTAYTVYTTWRHKQQVDRYTAMVDAIGKKHDLLVVPTGTQNESIKDIVEHFDKLIGWFTEENGLVSHFTGDKDGLKDQPIPEQRKSDLGWPS